MKPRTMEKLAVIMILCALALMGAVCVKALFWP
jgi:hypothetical protein